MEFKDFASRTNLVYNIEKLQHHRFMVKGNYMGKNII